LSIWLSLGVVAEELLVAVEEEQVDCLLLRDMQLLLVQVLL
jgi:hypothetical protein